MTTLAIALLHLETSAKLWMIGDFADPESVSIRVMRCSTGEDEFLALESLYAPAGVDKTTFVASVLDTLERRVDAGNGGLIVKMRMDQPYADALICQMCANRGYRQDDAKHPSLYERARKDVKAPTATKL